MHRGAQGAQWDRERGFGHKGHRRAAPRPRGHVGVHLLHVYLPPPHRPWGHKLGGKATRCQRAPQECRVARCHSMTWDVQSLTWPPAISWELGSARKVLRTLWAGQTVSFQASCNPTLQPLPSGDFKAPRRRNSCAFCLGGLRAMGASYPKLCRRMSSLRLMKLLETVVKSSASSSTRVWMCPCVYALGSFSSLAPSSLGSQVGTSAGGTRLVVLPSPSRALQEEPCWGRGWGGGAGGRPWAGRCRTGHEQPHLPRPPGQTLGGSQKSHVLPNPRSSALPSLDLLKGPPWP